MQSLLNFKYLPTGLHTSIQAGMHTACRLQASEKLQMSRPNSEKTSTTLQVGTKWEKRKGANMIQIEEASRE